MLYFRVTAKGKDYIPHKLIAEKLHKSQNLNANEGKRVQKEEHRKGEPMKSK